MGQPGTTHRHWAKKKKIGDDPVVPEEWMRAGWLQGTSLEEKDVAFLPRKNAEENHVTWAVLCISNVTVIAPSMCMQFHLEPMRLKDSSRTILSEKAYSSLFFPPGQHVAEGLQIWGGSLELSGHVGASDFWF